MRKNYSGERLFHQKINYGVIMFKIVMLMVSVLTITFSITFAQNENGTKELLIRCDDIGMCHSVNMAAAELIKTGIPFSASIMFACPWYQEAVEILKNHPQVTVGIHLTLNAEWKNYRWGPVAGRTAVPSLVDSLGYFFPSRAAFDANHPKLKDIETELRAQIKRALASGLDIKYVDYHMSTAVEKPEYRAILEKLAKEYHLGISRYFGEEDIPSMYSDPIDSKADSLYNTLGKINDKQVNLLVCHIGLNNPEMAALIDLNSFGLKEMSRHRNAELNALLSPKFLETIKVNHIKLINYGDLINKVGLKNMKRPPESELM